MPSSIGIHLSQLCISRIRRDVSLGNPPELQHISLHENAEDARVRTIRLGNFSRIGRLR